MKFWQFSVVSSLAFPVATLAANVYDYIVVGSGPGGAPVAANLAKAGASVLLLEAGDDQGATNLHVEIPTAAWAGMVCLFFHVPTLSLRLRRTFSTLSYFFNRNVHG